MWVLYYRGLHLFWNVASTSSGIYLAVPVLVYHHSQQIPKDAWTKKEWGTRHSPQRWGVGLSCQNRLQLWDDHAVGGVGKTHHCSGKDTHQCPLHPLTLQKPHAADAEQAGAHMSESLACGSMPQQLETKTNKEMGWKLPKIWKHWIVFLGLGTLKSCANWGWSALRITAGKLVILDVLYFFVETVIKADRGELSHWCCSGSKGLPTIQPCSWPWGSEIVVWNHPAYLAQFRKSCSFPPGKRVFWIRILKEPSWRIHPLGWKAITLH